MAGKKIKPSQATGAARIARAEQVVADSEVEVEDAFRAEIARGRRAGEDSQEWLEEYARNIALEYADALPDETVILVNEVFDVVFDPDSVGAETLVEDPAGAHLLQMQVAFQDHLEAHLLQAVEADRDWFFPFRRSSPRAGLS
jgi:hypothetical protein